MRLTLQQTGGRVVGRMPWGNKRREYMRKPYAIARKPSTAMTRYKKRRPSGFLMAPYKRRPKKPYRTLKTTRINYKVATDAGGSTTSRLVFGRKTPPRNLAYLYKNNQKYSYELLTGVRRNSIFGKQSVSSLNSLERTVLEQLFDTIPQITTTTRSTGKFIVQDLTIRSVFTNMDLATAYVTLYEIVPRFHITDAITPLLAWDKGLEDQSVIPGVNEDYRDAYATPFASQLFCLFYKINKVVNFELQQGQSHSHEVVHHIHKEVHGQFLSSYNQVRDVTKCMLKVISGTPINDLSAKGLVSTSSCAVDIVTKTIVNYTYAASQRTIRRSTNTLGAITSAELVSIGSGLVQVEDEA